MDGRWSVCLVAGLLAGLTGCSLLPGKTPKSAGEQSANAPAPPDPIKEPISNELVKNLKPKTLVAMGGFHIQMAEDIARKPEDKQRLYGQAIVAYQEALKQDPKYVPAHLAMAQLLEKMERPEQAVASLDAAANCTPGDPTIWHAAGMCLCRAKQWEAAVPRLRKAAELDPSNRQIVSSYALTLARLGKHEECLTWLKKVNEPAEAHYTLARMLHHMKDMDHCKEQLELALQSEPAHTGAQQLARSLTPPPAPDSTLPGAGSMNAN